MPRCGCLGGGEHFGQAFWNQDPFSTELAAGPILHKNCALWWQVLYNRRKLYKGTDLY